MQYRREIDGLRAVAVVPVILFHAGVEVFGGGFVGVDVFFVISGYLITCLLLQEMESDTFSIARFYERRARRILPALFFVMAACIPFAWMWMVPDQMEDFGESITAVVFFVSNFLFWSEEGYFAAAAELKPLLHTWSLAVEEQYYIFAPLFLMFFWKRARHLLFPAVIATAIASLLLAEWGSRNAPSAAFYLTPFRVWELLAGSICGFLTYRKPFKGNEGLAAAGLALILFAVFFYGGSTPFPGLYALAPVGGAALIVLFAREGTLVARLLSTRLLVGIGLISYSAYLWHQPLLAFARIRTMGEAPEWLLLSLAAASLVLAYFSWRFIEQPFRRGNVGLLPTRRAVFTASAAAGAVFLTLGIYGDRSDGVPWRGATPPAAGTPAAQLLASFKGPKLNMTCTDKQDFGIDKSAALCAVFNPPDAKLKILVLGDSHSGAILPAFAAVGKENAVYHMGMGGCPGLLDVSVVAGNYPMGVCEKLARVEYDLVKERGFDVVVLVGRWSLYTFGLGGAQRNYYLAHENASGFPTAESSRAVFAEALADTVRRYREIGVGVVVVDQVPQQLVSPRALIEQAVFTGMAGADGFNNIVLKASPEIARSEQMQAYAKAATDKLSGTGVWVWSFDDAFVRDGRYVWGDEGGAYYGDTDHLTNYGARRLTDRVATKFAEVAKALADQCGAEINIAATGTVELDMPANVPCPPER